jgi:hypothetical protein
VEEDSVPRVREQDDHQEQRSAAAEHPRSQEPRHDRRRVEQRHHRLGENAAGEVEQRPGQERRERCASQQVSEIDRMRVEELGVGA